MLLHVNYNDETQLLKIWIKKCVTNSNINIDYKNRLGYGSEDANEEFANDNMNSNYKKTGKNNISYDNLSLIRNNLE